MEGRACDEWQSTNKAEVDGPAFSLFKGSVLVSLKKQIEIVKKNNYSFLSQSITNINSFFFTHSSLLVAFKSLSVQ